ncbi:MAG: hypothetical protein ABGY71_05905 [bacterium]|nr:hypothetical protein [Planctomycetota bacterium]HIL51498.1 hypothetical protein [Planctomycetota bacterium]
MTKSLASTPVDGWKGLLDPSVWALLVLVFGLQLLALGRVDGYQLADSVEYMERAQALVRGTEVIDSQAIRSFGFVLVLAPVFFLADALGVEDFKAVVTLVRLLQMFLGLALVFASVRLTVRLAGRRAGLVAGLVVGLNPYFLLYSVSPVSGVAAALCLTLGLDACLRFDGKWRGLMGGAWLGGALVMAYKTVIIAVPILLLVSLVGGRRSWRNALGAWAGYGLGIFGAAGLDRVCYGEWGKSLDLYSRMNFGYLATRLSARLGLDDLARWFWEYTGGDLNAYYSAPESTPQEFLHEPNALYHLVHLADMVVWPLLVLFVLGLGNALVRADRKLRVVALVFLVSATAFSLKRSTDFRLLLPLLGCIGLVAGLGWRVLVGQERPLARNPRAWLALALVLAGGFVGQGRLAALGTRRFHGYWQAMAVVDAMAAKRGEVRVACAWHWAVFLRESEGVSLKKLPHQLDRWDIYDETQRARSIAALEEIDALICNLGLLLAHPSLFGELNRLFAVETVLYRRESYESVGPIVIFVRRSEADHGRSFLTRTQGEAPLAYIAARGLQGGRRFKAAGSIDRPLTLLGWKLEPLPGRGHAWLSLHWLCDSPGIRTDYRVRPRITTDLLELPWEAEYSLGRSLAPPATWREAEIISEGWPVVAAAAPFDWRAPHRPLYGDESPGTAVAGTLWLRVLPAGEHGLALWPITSAGGVLVTNELLDQQRRGPDGLRITREGFVELGAVEIISPER